MQWIKRVLRENLQHVGDEFRRAYDRMSQKIKIDMNKILMIWKAHRENIEQMKENGKRLEEVMKFKYLWKMINLEGKVKEKLIHRIDEGRKFWETLGKLWKENVIFREIQRTFYERVVISKAVQYSDMWVSSVQ